MSHTHNTLERLSMTKAIGKREALDISALDIIAICRVLEEPTCARGAAFRAAGAVVIQ